MERNELKTLFENTFGNAPRHISQLGSSGSSRRYYRISDDKNSAVGTFGENRAENEAFIYLSRHFHKMGLSVPEIYDVSPDSLTYLQEDLGDTSLYSILHSGDAPIKECMHLLAAIQFRGAENLNWEKCFPIPQMDRRSIMWDLNYFKYCFLKPSGTDFHEAELEDAFEAFAELLLDPTSCPWAFMVRDFQSRNIMIKDSHPWLIDFQGGRFGPTPYDLASFLWQARAGFSNTFRNEMVDEYLAEAEKYTSINKNKFKHALKLFVTFRMMQVLGAYGFRGLIEGKAEFCTSIPTALHNLKEQIPFLPEHLDGLKNILTQLCNTHKFDATSSANGLTVRVISFSYKRGIPDDFSGNGGGFVFDCRAIHNPGRYEQYKHLTGLDSPVIRFLEDNGEILTFLNHCKALAASSVERYLKRGFTNLMICFGCTGGRHRSVYCAEAMARFINQTYGVEVILEHREQKITQRLCVSKG